MPLTACPQLIDSSNGFPTEAPKVPEKPLSRGNDLIFFGDVGASGQLNCRWIQACLI
jgi:hypothetical protein